MNFDCPLCAIRMHVCSGHRSWFNCVLNATIKYVLDTISIVLSKLIRHSVYKHYVTWASRAQHTLFPSRIARRHTSRIIRTAQYKLLASTIAVDENKLSESNIHLKNWPSRFFLSFVQVFIDCFVFPGDFTQTMAHNEWIHTMEEKKRIHKAKIITKIRRLIK